MREVVEELRKIVDSLTEKGEAVLLIGDFNARIGRWQINQEGEAREIRESEDLTVNNEGKKLLEFCGEIGGII